MSEEQRDPLESVEPTRRSFIKKMAAAAFVAPVISSFGMESLASASNGKPRQLYPNQTEHPPRCDDPWDRKHKKHKKKRKKRKTIT
ncbi:MAG: hypothetical protein AB7L17_13280 [Ilumatobacteraceae bacterium]|jgi:hypothetical protein